MNTAELILRALQPFRLKKVGQNQYRCDSPLRKDSDSQAFSLTIQTDEHGAYHDHVSGESGSLYDLADRLGLAPPQKIASTKAPYAGLADYARRHGITPEALMEWNWYETTYQDRPALAFPTQTGLRYRFLDGKPKAAVYKSVFGYKSCWYGFNQFVQTRLQRGDALVICNGEASTIAGQCHGIASICVTGGEKAEIPSHLLDELKGKLSALPGVQIIIAMDCDSTGVKSGLGLKTQFTAAGLNARAVDLTLGHGGDLADFCMSHGEQSPNMLEELPDLRPVETETPPYDWRVCTVDELLALPPIEWLIPAKLPRRGVCTLYGASGSYKSFVALDFALVVAQNLSVIYVAAEGEYGFKARVKAWMKHHGQGYRLLTFVLGAVNLFSEDEFTYFQQALASRMPSMIVIDTFAMCMGDADENNTKDMMVLIRRAKQLAASLDCAVLFVHHTNKEGIRERGNGRLRDSCDTMMKISRLDDDLISISCEKTKDSAPFPTYYLRQLTVKLGYPDSLGQEATSLVLLPENMVEEAEGLTEHQRKVLQALEFDPDCSISEVCAITEIPHRGQVQKLMKRLEQKGYLERNGKSRTLTPKGEMALTAQTGDSADSGDSGPFRLSDYTQQRADEISGVTGVIESPALTQRQFLNGNTSKHHYTEGL